MKYAVIVGPQGSGKSTASHLVAQKLGPSAIVFNGAQHKEFICPQESAKAKPEFILVDNASKAPQLLKSALQWCEVNQGVLVCIDGDMPAIESSGLDASLAGMTIEIVGFRDTVDGPLFECKGVGEVPSRDLSAQDLAMILSMFRVNLVSKSFGPKPPTARLEMKTRNTNARPSATKGSKMERGAYTVVTPSSQVTGFLVLLVWMLETEAGLEGMLLASLCLLGILRVLKNRLYWIGRPTKESTPVDFSIHVALGMCSGTIAGYFSTALTSVLMSSP